MKACWRSNWAMEHNDPARYDIYNQIVNTQHSIIYEICKICPWITPHTTQPLVVFNNLVEINFEIASVSIATLYGSKWFYIICCASVCVRYTNTRASIHCVYQTVSASDVTSTIYDIQFGDVALDLIHQQMQTQLIQQIRWQLSLLKQWNIRDQVSVVFVCQTLLRSCYSLVSILLMVFALLLYNMLACLLYSPASSPFQLCALAVRDDSMLWHTYIVARAHARTQTYILQHTHSRIH